MAEHLAAYEAFMIDLFSALSGLVGPETQVQPSTAISP